MVCFDFVWVTLLGWLVWFMVQMFDSGFVSSDRNCLAWLSVTLHVIHMV